MTFKAILSVYDSAVDAYAPPMTFQSVQQGIRTFIQEVNRADPNNQLHNTPDDFHLVHLANWDENTGIFHHHKDGPETVARAKDHKVNPA